MCKTCETLKLNLGLKPRDLGNWKLVDRQSGHVVVLPFETTDFRGDPLIIAGGRPPHKPGSAG